MTDRCEVPRCRGEVDLIYLDRGICEKHWQELTADDASPDALRMVLGLEANAATAMEADMSETVAATETVATKEEPMATTAKKTKPKSKGAARSRTTKTTTGVKATKTAPKQKDQKRKTEKRSKPARVFAIRVTDEELAAIHKAAGPRNASRFIRTVAAAFASADESAFRAVLKEARETAKA